ncbi:unnamed protein product, partial [Rotaria magnacalcarata]
VLLDLEQWILAGGSKNFGNWNYFPVVSKWVGVNDEQPNNLK